MIAVSCLRVLVISALVLASGRLVHGQIFTDDDDPYVPRNNRAVRERNGRITAEESERLFKAKIATLKRQEEEGIPSQAESEKLILSAKYYQFLDRCAATGKLPAINREMRNFFNETNILVEDLRQTCQQLGLKSIDRDKTRHKRSYVYREAGLWHKCIIPYRRSNLPSSVSNVLDITIAFYEKYTGFRFVRYTGRNANYGLNHNNYLNFINGQGCYSYVGNLRGRGQDISPCPTFYTQVHEIGHALGMNHEQKHPLSMEFVTIHFNNIDPTFHSQYFRDWVLYVTGNREFYDIASVMHYANWGFSRNYGATMTANDPDLDFLMGSDSAYYMFRDVQSYQRCFSEFSSCSSPPSCTNGGYPSVVDGNCKCICPEGLDPDDNCRTVLNPPAAPTSWPEGTFTLLKSSLGECPDGFSEGRLSYTNPEYAKSGGSKLSPGFVDGYEWHQDVCSQTTSSKSGYKWPKGQYCILKYRKNCPAGFTVGQMNYNGDEAPSYGNTGTLPHGGHGQEQEFVFCCRSDAHYKEKITLPTDKPFILYRQDYWGCQEVEGMNVLGEYYRMQGYSRSNDTEAAGSLPYTYQWDTGMVNTYYCVYTPKVILAAVDYNIVKQFDTTEDTWMVIQTPNYPSNYDSGVEIMWHFRSPEGTRMMIDFQDFEVSASEDECDGYVGIRNYFPASPPREFCGENNLRTHMSYFNSLTVSFNSGSSSYRGFFANVSVIKGSDMCYNGDGSDGSYTGTMNYTQYYTPCLPWSEVTNCLYNQFDSRMIDFDLTNNYCRNVGTGQMPWCYVSKEECRRENCDVCQLGRCFDLADDCTDRLVSEPDYCTKNELGEAERLCKNTCGWCSNTEEQAPARVEVSCGSPPMLGCMSPEPVQELYKMGDQVTYTCPYSNEFRTSTCTGDGTWSYVSSVCNICPTGWSVVDRRCFKWIGWKSPQFYPDAKSTCEGLGARLVKADNNAVNEFVRAASDINVEDTDFIWLGMRDSGTNNRWVWDDGTDVTFNRWKSGEPNRNGGDCAYAGQGEWGVVACGDTYALQVICEYPIQSDETVCDDNIPNCMEVLEATPDLCTSQSDYAWHNCRGTCALGDCTTPITCTFEEGVGSSLVPGSPTTISQGQAFEYRCETDYFLVYGDLKRACLPNERLTGQSPTCTSPELTDRVEVFSTRELYNREYVDDFRVRVAPDADMVNIPYNGKITEWIFYSSKVGQATFQIWRKTGSNKQYQLIGQNVVSQTADNAKMIARVPPEEQIVAQEGDFIGIISDGVVRFHPCYTDIMPENALWYDASNTGDAFNVGQTYSFGDSEYDCRAYSIRVTMNLCGSC